MSKSLLLPEENTVVKDDEVSLEVTGTDLRGDSVEYKIPRLLFKYTSISYLGHS